MRRPYSSSLEQCWWLRQARFLRKRWEAGEAWGHLQEKRTAWVEQEEGMVVGGRRDAF